jgi:ABC-2 type transport system permease protein
MLVLMVGVLARELWALPGLWIFALANGAGMLLAGFTPGLVALAAAVIASGVLSRDMRAFRLNPVMLKELRGRMRGMRAFVVMTVYLGLMSGFATLLYLLYTTGMRTSASAAAGEIGRVLFMGIVGIELLLIIFIAPAFTAGAITGERERQTYDLLRTTLLASPSFVIGKLESALGYILLLLLAAIPLQSIAFLFGGVSETEIILSFIILAVSAVALGTVGIYFSSVMQRTLTASVRAYTVTLVATFAVPLVVGLIISILTTALYGAGANSGNSPVLEAFLNYVQLLLTSMNPVSTALTTQELLINRQVMGFWTQTLTSNGSTIPMVSPWISFTILYLTASAVLIVLTIRSTRRVEM